MTQRTLSISALLLGIAAANANAQQGPSGFDPAGRPAQEIHAHMRDLAQQIHELRANNGPGGRLAVLQREYDALKTLLGGDDPANAGRIDASGNVESELQGPLEIGNPSCGAVISRTTINGTTGLISLGITPATYTCVVSGVGTFLWDVDLTTAITHTASGDVDMTLRSPAGTTVVITTDNGTTHDNVFNGTTWNDSVNPGTAADFNYVNNTVATPLNPEGRLAAFRGENPNGTWTLTISDDAQTNTGSLNAWSLAISTASAPATSTTTFSDTPNIVMATAPTGSYPDTQIVSGVGTWLAGLKLYVEIPHGASNHLDLLLTPPSGPQIKVSTDNGGQTSNCFDGTTFDPDSTNAVTDFVYVGGTVASLLSPEGSFDNWLGINPNGTWTLQVNDDTLGTGGTFERWDLIVTTASAAVTPSSPVVFNGTTGAFVDSGNGGPSVVNFTAAAGGLGAVLWDVDLALTMPHAMSSDLDVLLTSPAGTTVLVSTDNGDADSFAGTLFDDNYNAPVTEAAFTAGTTLTKLAPEGRFSAFRGENPNGTWTLTVEDDFAFNGGSVTGWSLALSTIAALPTATTSVFTSTPGTAITASGTATYLEPLAVTGLGNAVTNVVCSVEITHTYGEDLDLWLISPHGVMVALTTDNAGSNDNTFGDGGGQMTRFDGDVLDTASDHAYVNNIVASPLSPEGPFDAFNGAPANGTWTLRVDDDENFDGGVIVQWQLEISTCASVATTQNCQIAPTVTQSCDSFASHTGRPSASLATQFVVTFGGMNAQANSVVFYGLSGPVSSPWGTQSLLCVKSPTQRLGGVPGAFGSTGGQVGLCNGQLSFDFNPIIQGSGLLGTPMSAGQQVDMQGWQRDPASSKTTALTDSLRFTVQP